MNEKQKRAKVGGEVGANGEFYEGGKFIATKADRVKSQREAKAASRKQEVEPYKWEASGDHKKISIYASLAGCEKFNRETLQFTFNDGLGGYFATPEAIAQRKERIAAFNAGERWFTNPTEI